MSSSICNDICKLFERELRRRLETRSTKYASESMLLLSGFRFSDSLNTGFINKTQWITSFKKIGLTGFSDQDLSFLFDYYDNNQTGLINYKEFALFLLNPNNYNAFNTPHSPISIHYRTKQYFDQLLESLRTKINVEGGLLYYLLLERMFKASYRMIHYDILFNCFRDLNIPTGVRQLKDFFALIDANDSKWIGIEQIMQMIRGKIPLNRVNVLRKCFENIDREKKRLISIDDLLQLYSSNNDIEVRYGRAHERNVYEHFALMIKIYSEWKKVKMLSIDDFIEFYEPISASIESDNYFIEMVKSNWSFSPILFENVQRKNEENNVINNPIYNSNEDYNVHDQIRDRDNHLINNSIENNNSYQIQNDYHQSSIHDLNDQRNVNEYKTIQYKKARRTPILNNTPKINYFNSNGNINQQNCQLSGNYLNKSSNFTFNRNKPQNLILKPTVSERKDKTPCYQQFINQVPKAIIDNRNNYNNSVLPPINQTSLINKSKSQPLIEGIPIYPKQNTYSFNQPKTNSQSKTLNTILKELSTQAIQKLQQLLSSRGEKGIFCLLRMLVFYDRNYSRKISLSDLSTLLQSYRLNLTQEEIEALYTYYTKDNSELMSYENFINDLIGEMNQKRYNLIKQLFEKLDKRNLGFLNIDDIKADYNSSRHPDAIEGKKTAEELLGEWLENIEAFCIYNNLSINNRSIFAEEFAKFYSLISFSIPNDRYFGYLIYNVWNINYQHYEKGRRKIWS